MSNIYTISQEIAEQKESGIKGKGTSGCREGTGKAEEEKAKEITMSCAGTHCHDEYIHYTLQPCLSKNKKLKGKTKSEH